MNPNATMKFPAEKNSPRNIQPPKRRFSTNRRAAIWKSEAGTPRHDTKTLDIPVNSAGWCAVELRSLSEEWFVVVFTLGEERRQVCASATFRHLRWTCYAASCLFLTQRRGRRQIVREEPGRELSRQGSGPLFSADPWPLASQPFSRFPAPFAVSWPGLRSKTWTRVVGDRAGWCYEDGERVLSGERGRRFGNPIRGTGSRPVKRA